MDITRISVGIYHLVQKTYPTKMIVNPTTLEFSYNISYPKWIGACLPGKILAVFLGTFTVVYSYLTTFGQQHLKSCSADQTAHYGKIAVGIGIMSLGYGIMSTKHDDIRQILNDTIHTYNNGNCVESTTAKHSFLERISVCVGFALYALVLVGFSFLPLAINYDPLQLLFGTDPWVKYIAVPVYFVSVWPGVATTMSAFLITFVWLDQTSLFCRALNFSSQRIRDTNKLFIAFRQAHKKHLLITILTTRCVNICANFYTGIIFLAILLASCEVYATFKMYNQLSFVVWIVDPIVLISFVIGTLTCTYWACVQYRHSQISIRFWKRVIKTKQERKMLASLKANGIKVGAYGLVDSRLGLCICDDMIQNAIDLLILLDS